MSEELADGVSQDIVPEGFDIDTARNAQSTTDRDDRVQCIACSSVCVSPSGTNGFSGERADHDYRCEECGKTFDREDT